MYLNDRDSLPYKLREEGMRQRRKRETGKHESTLTAVMESDSYTFLARGALVSSLPDQKRVSEGSVALKIRVTHKVDTGS